jgi:hypothetical protein
MSNHSVYRACAAENGREKIGLKKISLNNEKLCDILFNGSKTLHISYDEKEKKETKAFFI